MRRIVIIAASVLLLASCALVDAAEPAAKTKGAQTSQEAGERPIDADTAPTSPGGGEPDHFCIQQWSGQAHRLERTWDRIESNYVSDLLPHGIIASLANTLFLETYDASEAVSEECAYLAEPVLEEVMALREIDADEWTMFPEHYEEELQATRDAMRDFLVSTASIPTHGGRVSIEEEAGRVTMANDVKEVVFALEKVNSAEEVAEMFEAVDSHVTATVIAPEVSITNFGANIYDREVSFIWSPTASDSLLRPVTLLDQSGGGPVLAQRDRPSEGQEPATNNMLLFFEIFPDEEEGELYASIDGITWTNLSAQPPGDTMIITDDWRRIP